MRKTLFKENCFFRERLGYGTENAGADANVFSLLHAKLVEFADDDGGASGTMDAGFQAQVQDLLFKKSLEVESEKASLIRYQSEQARKRQQTYSAAMEEKTARIQELEGLIDRMLGESFGTPAETNTASTQTDTARAVTLRPACDLGPAFPAHLRSHSTGDYWFWFPYSTESEMQTEFWMPEVLVVEKLVEREDEEKADTPFSAAQSISMAPDSVPREALLALQQQREEIQQQLTKTTQELETTKRDMRDAADRFKRQIDKLKTDAKKSRLTSAGTAASGASGRDEPSDDDDDLAGDAEVEPEKLAEPSTSNKPDRKYSTPKEAVTYEKKKFVEMETTLKNEIVALRSQKETEVGALKEQLGKAQQGSSFPVDLAPPAQD